LIDVDGIEDELLYYLNDEDLDEELYQSIANADNDLEE
jgi:hypothetical protein